jgi:hypothetical protein
MAKVRQIRPEWMYGLDQEQIDFYLGLDPEQAMCRGGRRHDFHMQDLIAGRDWPEAIELVPAHGGVYQLTDHCERGCGRWIRYDTLPGGAIDWDSARYGGGGARYHATGLGLTAGDDKLYMHYLQDQVIADRIKLMRKRAAS